MKVCGTCRWWDGYGRMDDDPVERGHCMYYPPRPAMIPKLIDRGYDLDQLSTGWPITEDWQGCSKWKRKPDDEGEE